MNSVKLITNIYNHEELCCSCCLEQIDDQIHHLPTSCCACQQPWPRAVKHTRTVVSVFVFESTECSLHFCRST